MDNINTDKLAAELTPGKVIIITGPNESGKTRLLRKLADRCKTALHSLDGETLDEIETAAAKTKQNLVFIDNACLLREDKGKLCDRLRAIAGKSRTVVAVKTIYKEKQDGRPDLVVELT